MSITAIVLEILLGLVFLMAGSMKIMGSKMHVDSFERWKLPQWFRIVTGLVEVIGAIGMIVGIWKPAWVAWAGIWLGITMFGGVLVHIRAKDPFSQTVPGLVLLVLSLTVTLIYGSELSTIFS